MNTPEQQKSLVAEYIIDHLPEEGIIALGSGSTVNKVIHHFALNQDHHVQFVSASSLTSLQLKKHNLPEVTLSYAIDAGILLGVDGADQVLVSSPYIIKGHGGALLREKIIWRSSSKMYVLVDSSKLSYTLTKSIPLEILPFAYPLVEKYLAKLEQIKTFRLQMSNSLPFYTDNGNYLVHIQTEENVDLDTIHSTLISHPGILETGIFNKSRFSHVDIIVGTQDGVVIH